MVERFLGVEEVVGSNPAAPTNVGLIAFTFIVKAFFMFKRKLGHAGGRVFLPDIFRKVKKVKY